MREIALFSWKIHTAGTNFTRPPVVMIATNLNSGEPSTWSLFWGPICSKSHPPPTNTQRLHCIISNRTLCQVDQSISHHDMWDYLELTQKGYSKAFEPVNELLTQVFLSFFCLRESREMKKTLSANLRDGGRVVQT